MFEFLCRIMDFSGKIGHFRQKTLESPLSSFMTPKTWKDRRVFIFKLIKTELKRRSTYNPFLTVKTWKDCRIFVVSDSIFVIKRRVIDRFLPFRIRGTNYEKYSLVVMIKLFSQVLFYTFFGLGRHKFTRKDNHGVFLSFFRLSKLKNVEFLLYWTR